MPINTKIKEKLDEKYALGEITEEEYRKRISVLEETNSQSGRKSSSESEQENSEFADFDSSQTIRGLAVDSEIGPAIKTPDGYMVKRYLLVEKLGQGGMGAVWLADDRLSDIKVAIKVLPYEVAHSKSEMEEVKDNYKKVEQLHHPNIAAVKALEFDENQNVGYFIVMEHVKGTDLKYWMKKKFKKNESVSIEEAVKILRPIAEALDYAHSKKLIHRDIKPENIMLTEDLSEVKVLDFGLAAQIRSSLSMVSMKAMDTSGTRPYMSPEQWRGKRQNEQTDQYSLAVVAYEMLSGCLPFNAEDFGVLRECVLNEEPEKIEEREAQVNETLQKGLSKTKEERFIKCVDFVKSLLEKRTKSQVFKEVKIESSQNVNYDVEQSKQSEIIIDLGDNISLDMILVEAGTFMMGSSENESGRYYDEQQHRVTLTRDYYIGKYPVTQDQWEVVMGNNPSYFKETNRPVECVSWDDAQEFITKLNQMTSKNFRLPTEAEWEYAARGGNKSKGYIYSGSNNIDEVAWYGNNSGDKKLDTDRIWREQEDEYFDILENNNNQTHLVGQKKANELGIYDMSGNVWEWCSDWYGDYPSGNVTDPIGVSNGSSRVFRGGSWCLNAGDCRSANRFRNTPVSRDSNLGFRLCLPAGR